MVNAYVDDLVGRGLLDVTGDTNRTYRYTLTPAGEARRDEIFFEISREIFQLYGRVREEMRLRLQERSAGAPVEKELSRQLALSGAEGLDSLKQASA
jgi:DNA-binding PadR family transcriptional regulator